MAYAAILIILNLALGYYLKSYETVDLAENDLFFPVMRWEDYYAFSDSIDILVLGSSHAYRTFNPPAIEAELSSEYEIFNFGSSAQSPVTAYYILEEVLSKHQPKLVIVDLYPLVFMGNDMLKNGLINFEYMNWGKPKRDFFTSGFSAGEQSAILLFPTYAYRKYFKGKIKKLIGRQYLPPPKGRYRGGGFVSNPDTLSMEKLIYNNQFDRFEFDLEMITDHDVAYLKRIVEKCKNTGVLMMFTTAPIPEISVQKIENYREFHLFFQELAKELSVPYCDFNLERVPTIKDEYHFYDDDHLNTAGALLFSKAIAEKIKNLSLE